MESLITISFIICLFLFLFLSLSPTLSLPFSLLLCLFFSFSLTHYLNFSPSFAISLSHMLIYLLLPFHECNSNSNAAKAVRSLFGPHICGNSLDICGTFDRYYLIDFLFKLIVGFRWFTCFTIAYISLYQNCFISLFFQYYIYFKVLFF